MKTLPNGLLRYYADRVRDQTNWRISDAYDIIDCRQGHMYPVKRCASARDMEIILARLNA